MVAAFKTSTSKLLIEVESAPFENDESPMNDDCDSSLEAEDDNLNLEGEIDEFEDKEAEIQIAFGSVSLVYYYIVSHRGRYVDCFLV
jgi:hypothetical protein